MVVKVGRGVERRMWRSGEWRMGNSKKLRKESARPKRQWGGCGE
jgi:hypothetical protein